MGVRPRIVPGLFPPPGYAHAETVETAVPVVPPG